MYWIPLILAATLVLVLTPNVWAQSRAGKASEQVTTTLTTLLNGYDKRVRPNYGGPPLHIGITMYVIMVESICDVHSEFTLTYYFRQTWVDPRLKFTGIHHSIPLIANDSRKIWIPDTFTANQKSVLISGENVRISADGEVIRSLRLTTTASCPMSLQFFPMDRQLCSLELDSFAFNMTDIKYYWGRGSDSIRISNEADIAVPNWVILGHKGQTFDVSFSTGNYSRLSVQLQFARSIGFYTMSKYMPAAILVVMSWIPLWFSGSDAMSARILTGVGSAVMLVHLWQTTSALLPKVSYVKAIDVYLAACVGFVVLSIIEHTSVAALVRGRKDYKKRIQNDSSMNTRKKPCCLCVAPKLLDWFFRLAFPIMFIAFNIAYWKLYLTMSDVKSPDVIPFTRTYSTEEPHPISGPNMLLILKNRQVQ